MVGKRSIYLKLLSFLIFGAVLIFFNAAVLHGRIPDVVYRTLGLASDKHFSSISEIAADESLKRENETLRKQLGVEPKKSLSLRMANIISIQRTAFVSTVVIDEGFYNGVEEGMEVLASGNVLAGKIGEVFEHTSRVYLVDDPRVIISVRIMGDNLLAESKGSLHDMVDVNLIAHSDMVDKGVTLVTSGLDGFKDGFAVAEISNIDKGSNSLFQKISGKTYFSIYESPYVFIVF